jgi:hypothetical protein
MKAVSRRLTSLLPPTTIDDDPWTANTTKSPSSLPSRVRRILRSYREQFLLNIIHTAPETWRLIEARQHHVFPLTALRGRWRYLPQCHEKLHYCSICAVWYISSTNLPRIRYILARFSQDSSGRHRPAARNTVGQEEYC